MGKPLKARALKGSSLRAAVLLRQGVKINKRARLGHTGHFGKILEVPVEKGGKEAGGDGKKKKSKFNKFKQQDGDAFAGGVGGGGGSSSRGHDAEGEDDQGKGHRRDRDFESAGSGDNDGKGGDRVERLPGESFCKFMKRLNTETSQKLNQQAAKANKVSTKRKEHLAKRKEQKKDKKDEKVIKRMTRNDGDELVGKDRVEERMRSEELSFVNFGEQALRPPMIKLSNPLKGIKKGANVLDAKGYIHGGIPGIPEVSAGANSKREFEMLRKNAIAQYRGMVQKKRVERGLATIG